MTFRNSSWTGRAPRSLTEALGPYATAEFRPEPSYSLAWCWAMAVVAVVGAVAIWLTR